MNLQYRQPFLIEVGGQNKLQSEPDLMQTVKNPSMRDDGRQLTTQTLAGGKYARNG